MVKNLPANAGYVGWIPGLGRSPGEGNGNPLQYSLENPMDRGAWRATVHGVTKSQTQLSTHAHTHTHTHTHTQTYQVSLEPRVSEQRGGRAGEPLPTKPRATLILCLMRAGQRGGVAATETRGLELKGLAALVLLSVLSLAYSKGPVCASAHPPCLWWPWVIC